MRLLTYNIREGGLGRAEQIARVIKSVDPDVVALQEARDPRTVEKIAKLTPGEIRRVAQEHLHPSKFAWVVVGNIAAIQAGDGVHPVKLSDLGTVVSVPLADPFTLERPQ